MSSRVNIPLNVISLVGIDVAAVAASAGLLWISAQSTVFDVPVLAMIVTVLVTATLLAFRRALSLRRRRDICAPEAVSAERAVAITEIILLAALGAAWMWTGSYLLGWFFAFASIAFLVASTLHLLADVTTRTDRSRPNRESVRRAQRLFSIEKFHALGAAVAIAGVILAAPVHEWRADILNGGIVLIATSIAGAVAMVAACTRAIRRSRENAI